MLQPEAIRRLETDEPEEQPHGREADESRERDPGECSRDSERAVRGIAPEAAGLDLLLGGLGRARRR